MVRRASARAEAKPGEAGPLECRECRGMLEVTQPGIGAPEILVGYCERCAALFMVDGELRAMGRAVQVDVGVRVLVDGRWLVVIEEGARPAAMGAAG